MPVSWAPHVADANHGILRGLDELYQCLPEEGGNGQAAPESRRLAPAGKCAALTAPDNRPCPHRPCHRLRAGAFRRDCLQGPKPGTLVHDDDLGCRISSGSSASRGHPAERFRLLPALPKRRVRLPALACGGRDRPVLDSWCGRRLPCFKGRLADQ